MKHVVCRSCESSFSYEARGGRTRLYCSRECQLKLQYDAATARREAAKPPKPACAHCGSEMKARRSDRKYCGATACQEVRQRADRDAVEASKGPRPECRNCGKQMPRREDAVYCDARPCRTAKYHAKQATRPRCSELGCGSPVIAKGLCGSHYSKVWRSENLDRSRDNRRARKARVRDAFVEPVLASEVFERDGWICGLCSSPIPRDAVWPDLLSPSVDHIVPLSRGGEHSMANVQASHLSCNSRKQASVPVEVVASVS